MSDWPDGWFRDSGPRPGPPGAGGSGGAPVQAYQPGRDGLPTARETGGGPGAGAGGGSGNAPERALYGPAASRAAAARGEGGCARAGSPLCSRW